VYSGKRYSLIDRCCFVKTTSGPKPWLYALVLQTENRAPDKSSSSQYAHNKRMLPHICHKFVLVWKIYLIFQKIQIFL